MLAKRIFDLIASGVGLLLLSPVFFLVALLIKLDSPGPVFFRQERVGRGGSIFRIHKFRTMCVNAEGRGLQITVGADSRVTRVGDFLRKSKIDELAQLLDVFLGTMSLVGPRPEVPRYVALYPISDRELIQSVKPGITDWASIKFKSESDILAESDDPHSAYVNKVLPIKLQFYRDYVRQRSFFGDLFIIFSTIFVVFPRFSVSVIWWRFFFFFCIVSVLFLALLPQSPSLPSMGWDKLNHLCAFIVLIVLGFKAFKFSLRQLLLLLFAFGWVIEFLQWCTPDRFFELSDVVADVVGLLCGFLFIKFCMAVQKKLEA